MHDGAETTARQPPMTSSSVKQVASSRLLSTCGALQNRCASGDQVSGHNFHEESFQLRKPPRAERVQVAS
jgi:hypothetical protein